MQKPFETRLDGLARNLARAVEARRDSVERSKHLQAEFERKDLIRRLNNELSDLELQVSNHLALCELLPTDPSNQIRADALLVLINNFIKTNRDFRHDPPIAGLLFTAKDMKRSLTGSVSSLVPVLSPEPTPEPAPAPEPAPTIEKVTTTTLTPTECAAHCGRIKDLLRTIGNNSDNIAEFIKQLNNGKVFYNGEDLYKLDYDEEFGSNNELFSEATEALQVKFPPAQRSLKTPLTQELNRLKPLLAAQQRQINQILAARKQRDLRALGVVASVKTVDGEPAGEGTLPAVENADSGVESPLTELNALVDKTSAAITDFDAIVQRLVAGEHPAESEVQRLKNTATARFRELQVALKNSKGSLNAVQQTALDEDVDSIGVFYRNTITAHAEIENQRAENIGVPFIDDANIEELPDEPIEPIEPDKPDEPLEAVVIERLDEDSDDESTWATNPRDWNGREGDSFHPDPHPEVVKMAGGAVVGGLWGMLSRTSRRIFGYSKSRPSPSSAAPELIHPNGYGTETKPEVSKRRVAGNLVFGLASAATQGLATYGGVQLGIELAKNFAKKMQGSEAKRFYSELAILENTLNHTINRLEEIRDEIADDEDELLIEARGQLMDIIEEETAVIKNKIANLQVDQVVKTELEQSLARHVEEYLRTQTVNGESFLTTSMQVFTKVLEPRLNRPEVSAESGNSAIVLGNQIFELFGKNTWIGALQPVGWLGGYLTGRLATETKQTGDKKRAEQGIGTRIKAGFTKYWGALTLGGGRTKQALREQRQALVRGAKMIGLVVAAGAGVENRITEGPDSGENINQTLEHVASVYEPGDPGLSDDAVDTDEAEDDVATVITPPETTPTTTTGVVDDSPVPDQAGIITVPEAMVNAKVVSRGDGITQVLVRVINKNPSQYGLTVSADTSIRDQQIIRLAKEMAKTDQLLNVWLSAKAIGSIHISPIKAFDNKWHVNFTTSAGEPLTQAQLMNGGYFEEPKS